MTAADYGESKPASDGKDGLDSVDGRALVANEKDGVAEFRHAGQEPQISGQRGKIGILLQAYLFVFRTGTTALLFL